MKNWKKLAATLLAALVLSGLAGCGKKTEARNASAGNAWYASAGNAWFASAGNAWFASAGNAFYASAGNARG